MFDFSLRAITLAHEPEIFQLFQLLQGSLSDIQ